MNNKEQYTLDDLFDAWNEQNVRVENIVKEHPVGAEMIHHHTQRTSYSRFLLIESALRCILCVAMMGWLVCFYSRYVDDVFDLIPHLLIGGVLIYAFIESLRIIVVSLRHSVSTASITKMLRLTRRESSSVGRYRTRPKGLFSFFDVQYPRIATLAAFCAILIVCATPAYDGRSMSAHGMEERAMVLASSNHIIDNSKILLPR